MKVRTIVLTTLIVSLSILNFARATPASDAMAEFMTRMLAVDCRDQVSQLSEDVDIETSIAAAYQIVGASAIREVESNQQVRDSLKYLNKEKFDSAFGETQGRH